MRFRRAVAAAMLVSASTLLAGCSVPARGVIGLSVVSDRVVAIVEMCDDVTTTGVVMHIPEERELPSWTFRRTGSIHVDLGSVEEFVDLMGGFEVSVSTLSSDGVGGFVRLDEDAIESIHDGEILVHDDHGDPTIVDLAGYQEEVEILCW